MKNVLEKKVVKQTKTHIVYKMERNFHLIHDSSQQQYWFDDT